MEEKRFGEIEQESRKNKTRREVFLERMEEVIVWEKLLEKIRPYIVALARVGSL